MKIRPVLSFLSLAVAGHGGAVAAPPPPPASQSGYGTHPEDHGPDVKAVGTRATHRAHPRHAAGRPAAARRWRMTAGHIRKCRHRYKTYNSRTDRYVARPGLRRRCVL